MAFEAIAAAFGHGEPSAEAIRDFLAFLRYHSWRGRRRGTWSSSATRATTLGTSRRHPLASPLPALWAKTSYLWTVRTPCWRR